MKEWYSAKDLVGLPSLPSTASNITRKAKSLGWEAKQKTGQKGRSFEYHIDSLPVETRNALILQAGVVKVDEQYIEIPKGTAKNYSREALWQRWNNAGVHAQAKATETLKAVRIATHMINRGIAKMKAYQAAVTETGLSLSSVRRGCNTVKGIEQTDWVAALLPKTKEAAQQARKKRFAFISPEAWEFFKADYLRVEEPALAACYERLKDAAKENGWTIPSYDSVSRRLDFEVPQEQQVLLRKGQHALMSMYPTQERTVLDLHALEWLNGDGYKHNVFVRWFNGEILRPVTWFWQDIYSRKIVGWRTDVSENTDSIRLSLMDVFEKYGIPYQITIDNTRAAANKWMTGGVPNRYRFKVKEDDPLGIIPLFDIQLHWTSVLFGKGHGQAKPVERAFGVGGIEEFVDKHPTNAGAYTGPNPMAKPDNYGSKAIDAEEFLKTVAKGIEMFNAREGRKTEVCQGAMSFDEAFKNSYETATVRKATKQQLQMMLLQAEAVKVSQQGTITLQAGGSLQGRKNRYGHEAMYAYIGKKLVARFDPQALHQSVEIYTLQGVFVCTAPCIEKVAFGDTQAAREHKRKRTQHVKSNKAAAEAQTSMDALELAAMMTPLEEEAPLESKVVEPIRPVVIGNTAAAVQVDEEFQTTCEINFAEAVERLAAEKLKNQL